MTQNEFETLTGLNVTFNEYLKALRDSGCTPTAEDLNMIINEMSK